MNKLRLALCNSRSLLTAIAWRARQLYGTVWYINPRCLCVPVLSACLPCCVSCWASLRVPSSGVCVRARLSLSLLVCSAGFRERACIHRHGRRRYRSARAAVRANFGEFSQVFTPLRERSRTNGTVHSARAYGGYYSLVFFFFVLFTNFSICYGAWIGVSVEILILFILFLVYLLLYLLLV